MQCPRCKTILGFNEGKFIEYNGKEQCVCPQCYEEVRQINIEKNKTNKSDNNEEFDLLK